MSDDQRSALMDRSLSLTNSGLSGSAASDDTRSGSIAKLIGIVGPIVLGLAGVAIRLDAFLRNFPLSLDEAAVARNIIDRPWTRLVGWLDYSQLAPPGFLFAEKAAVTLGGTSELALRSVPVLCAVLSVWLCWLVCRRLLHPMAALMAFGLFSLNTSLVEMGTRVKPYSGDITAALLLLLIATEVFQPAITRRKAVPLAVAGGLTSLFSFASVFVLAALAIAALYRAGRHAPPGRTNVDVNRTTLIIAAVIWTVSAGCGALIAQLSLSPADSEYMRWFWQPGFMPFPPKSVDDLFWVGHQLKATIRWTLFYRASVLWIGAAALGVWSLHRRQQQDTVIVLAMPFALIAAASAVKLYPFYTGRVNLFLLPLLLMLVAEGADWVRRTFVKQSALLAALPMVVLIVLGIHGTWSGWRIQRNGDLRAPLEYVKNNWQPGDRLFVHYTAGQVFLYYAPRLGFQSTDYIVGRCSDETTRTALWQVDKLRGSKRVWVLVWGADSSDLLFRYLDATAKLRETSPTTSMMAGTAMLYDLSASELSGVTPATLPVATDSAEPFEPASCYGVFEPWPASDPHIDR